MSYLTCSPGVAHATGECHAAVIHFETPSWGGSVPPSRTKIRYMKWFSPHVFWSLHLSCTAFNKVILESWLNIFLENFLRWKYFDLNNFTKKLWMNTETLWTQKFRRFQWKVNSIEIELLFCTSSQKNISSPLKNTNNPFFQFSFFLNTNIFAGWEKRPFQRWGPGIHKKTVILVKQKYQLLHRLPNGSQYFGNILLLHTPTRSQSTGTKENGREREA